MKKRRKTNTGYLVAILSLLLILLLLKIGGLGLLMIVITILIGIGAIYLSGESLGGIFGRRINVTSLDDLMKMNPYQFERFIGDYFRDCGYTVHQTKRSNDGGKDLVMYKGGQTYYVEVKRYSKSNGIQRPLIQKLVGACYPANARGIFVTTSYFSKGAIDEARRSNVQLIDGQKLTKLLKN